MKVILVSDLDKVGRKGDVVEVAAGYARNFLLPRKLALTATKGAVRQAEAMRRAREVRDRREREGAEALASRITSVVIRIPARAGDDGALFGSVTTSDIAERLESEIGEEIDRRKIELSEPIRSLGVHDYVFRVHHEIEAKGSVEVVAE